MKIGHSVETIEKNNFGYNSNLTSITLGNGLKKIDGYVFNDCDNLKSVTIPASVTYIGYGAFDGCDNLEHVYLIDAIGWTFRGDSKLTMNSAELAERLRNSSRWSYFYLEKKTGSN